MNIHGELELKRESPAGPVALAQQRGDAPESLVSLLNRLATNPQFNPESFSVLLAAAREEQLISRRAEFAAAMHAIQSQRLRVHKSKTAKNSKYAPLEEIDSLLQPHLERHGLSVSFDCPSVSESGLMDMVIKIYHSNGYSEDRHLPMPIDDIGTNREGKALRPKIQDHGSTVSYSRRQLLKMTFNVVETDEDDDGQLGVATKPITQEQADTLRSKCEEYGLGVDDKRRVAKFAATLQKLTAINSFDQVRNCDYDAVLMRIEEMRPK